MLTGDSEHKPYICGDADHSIFPLDGSEDYLILACDGFWDTVSPDEAVRVVSDHLQENTGDTTMVAHKLVASARDAGSSDNITVIVVFLRDPRSPPPTSNEDEDEEEAVVEGELEEEDVVEVEEEEQEEEEEEEEVVRVERGGGEGGSTADIGGKGRGGWPLQQCSAPADLAYEDRKDSFTDRTSLSLLGPSLEGRISLTPGWLQPCSGISPDLFTAYPLYREKGSLRSRSRIAAVQEPGLFRFTDPLWPQAAMLLGQTVRRSCRLGSGSHRWCRRWPGRFRVRLGLMPSGQCIPSTQRYPNQWPGVALPHLPHNAPL
ncbi:hypothetical protein LDENG_00224760 [Lucifuga dentata]|nr:hypothetical protein LDENG_00224760 [Lucifuga dentata]